MSEIDFERLSLADYAQLFQIGAVADSRRELLISLSADLDVLVSGRTYEYRERIKEIARESRDRCFLGWSEMGYPHAPAPQRAGQRAWWSCEAAGCKAGAQARTSGNGRRPRWKFLLWAATSSFPFQIEGISVIVETFRRGLKSFLLADEMGLGKTIQALGVAKVLGLEAVVIAPASVVPSWQEKAQECGIAAEVFSYAKADRAKATGKLLILDEAHYIKNKSAQRTKAVQAFSRGG
jgi:hypothetical protein